MKGDLDRKEELNGDHLVPITQQALEVLRALWPLTGEGELLFPSNRHMHRPISENAIGYLLNRAGYHGVAKFNREPPASCERLSGARQDNHQTL